MNDWVIFIMLSLFMWFINYKVMGIENKIEDLEKKCAITQKIIDT